MINTPSLDVFCTEMQRLAGVIEARSELLPACGGEDRGGLRIGLLDNVAYMLTYSEKGAAELVFEGTHPDAVMERVFVEVTQRMASEALSVGKPPITVEELTALTSLSVDEMRRRAEALQDDEGTIQFRLMNRLKPEWGQRQLERNAERARHIQRFFDGDRP